MEIIITIVILAAVVYLFDKYILGNLPAPFNWIVGVIFGLVLISALLKLAHINL